MLTRTHRRRAQHIAVLLLTAFFYLFFIPYFDRPGRGGLDNPNEITRVYTVGALVDHGHVYINDVMNRWPTRTTDMAARPREDRDPPEAPPVLYFAAKAPGMALYTAPFYAAYRALRGPMHAPSKRELVYVCRVLGATAPSIVLSFIFYLFLCRLSSRRHLVLCTHAVYVLGTLAYPYSLLFTSHQFVNGMLMGAMILLLWRKPTGWRRHLTAMLAGAMLGFAVAAEYSALVAAVLIGVLVLVKGSDGGRERVVRHPIARRRYLVSALVGAAVPGLALAAYHTASFGGPFATAYDHMVNPEFRYQWEHAEIGFNSFSPEALFSISLSPSNGLLFFSPFLVFAIPGLFVAVRSRGRKVGAVLAFVLIAWLFAYIPSTYFYRGGWTAGPRYVAAVVPPMIVLSLIALDAWSARAPLVAGVFAAWLASVSILITAPVATLFPHLPDSLINPYFELIVPMIEQRMISDNVLGLPDETALLVYGAMLALVLCLVLFGGQRSWLRRIAKGGLAASLVAASMFAYRELLPFDEAASVAHVRMVRVIAAEPGAVEPRWPIRPRPEP